MRKQEPYLQSQSFEKPTNVLLAIAARARNIRKLLANIEKPVDQKTWGLLRDAVRMADMIEDVSTKSVFLSAEDATTAVEMLELFIDQLETKVDFILMR